MDGGIVADAPLHYVAFRISPAQNRYEASICDGNREEILAEGLLEKLANHLPKVNGLCSEGSNATFKLQLPTNLCGAAWFTITTLKRFLSIAGSSDLFNNINAVKDEMSQLEKARNFHLSLYSQKQNSQHHSESREAGGYNSSSKAPTNNPEVTTMSSDASKNELLRAMDLRLSALKEELAASFNRAAGTTCCSEDILNLIKFSQEFGATELEEILCKLLELNPKKQTVDPLINEKPTFTTDSKRNNQHSTGGSIHTSKLEDSEIPVKYGVSPAKVAQVERQSSSESEGSSDHSNEQTSAERSRSRIRSASPRRSASPMRRIQIARVGSRRTAALTIKSLTNFPARERGFTHKDAAGNSSEEEGSDKPHRKPETNMLRMSVKDAISLFECKQRDQTADNEIRRSSIDISGTTSRSVLRRWSSGVGKCSIRSPPEAASEDCISLTSKKSVDPKIPEVEVRTEPETTSGGHNPIVIAEVDVKSNSCNESASSPIETQRDTIATQGEKFTEPLTASAKWNQQKEVEMKLLMQMLESKPVKSRKTENSRSHTSEQSGVFYDHYKEKRDEKLRSQNAGKRAEKEAHFKAMQQIIDKSKADMASKNSNNIVKKQSLRKTPQSSKNTTPTANTKKETPKPSITKKDASRVSPLPALRKSWPSTPPSRVTGTSPARIPSGVSPASAVPTRRKSQPTSLPDRSGPKVERPQQRQTDAKRMPTDSITSIKGRKTVQHDSVSSGGKVTKTKGLTASENSSSTVPTKTNFNRKVTKKSSVVPLETKPFLRKGSKFGNAVGPVAVKTKVSAQSEESVRDSEDLLHHEHEMVIKGSELATKQEKNIIALKNNDDALLSENQATSNQKCSNEKSDQITADDNDNCGEMEESSLLLQTEEESIISPSAWVEREEHHCLPVSCEPSTSQVASPAAAAAGPMEQSSPRIRHSLSQMLQEESNELDIVEWGNAENPPAMIYQKDSPKGFKRLLKFARKSKGDTHVTDWSSPSAFSEGEDDTEECKAFQKRNADSRLRKATSHAKNSSQQKSLLREELERREAADEQISDILHAAQLNKYNAQSSSYNSLEHNLGAVPATKASRSFFSLSAFRGSK